MTLATQTLYDWLLFLHVLAAMVWVGGGVMLAAIAARVLRDPDPDAVGRFTASLRSLGPLVLAPATVAVLGLGSQGPARPYEPTTPAQPERWRGPSFVPESLAELGLPQGLAEDLALKVLYLALGGSV